MKKGETAQGVYIYQKRIGLERGDAVMRRYLCKYCRHDNPATRAARVVYAYTLRQAAFYFNRGNRRKDGSIAYRLLEVVPLSTTPYTNRARRSRDEQSV